MDEPQYIIWDPTDGEPRRGEDGSFESSGLVGRVGGANAFVKVYAKYDEGTRRTPDGVPVLEVGQFARAEFSLSGSRGYYKVYRVS